MLTIADVQKAIDTGSYSISLQAQKEGKRREWNLPALVNCIDGNVVKERLEISPFTNNSENLVLDAIIGDERIRFSWTRIQSTITLIHVSALPLSPESQSIIRIDAIGMAA